MEKGSVPGLAIVMMITGAHVILSSTDADADRAFLRDVLGFTHVDAGDGWLIFGLPPAEIAVHPARKNGAHECFLMCADVAQFVATMRRHRVPCEPIADHGYGLVTRITLPGGGALGVYEPRHPRPKPSPAANAISRTVRRPTQRPKKRR